MKKSLFGALVAVVLFAGCATSTSKAPAEPAKSEEVKKEPAKEIPMGTLNHLTYKSEYCGMQRGVNIFLPADYDESKQYPVVYFLHGIFGNEYSMTSDPTLKPLIEKMCVENKEMIVVFPDMFARTDPTMQPDFKPEAVACYDNFVYDLLGDLMPWVKAHFSVLEGRENTAVCGFSMGGREALYIGLTHPEVFGYVGAFAPAPGLVPARDYAMEHAGQLKEEEVTFEGKEKPFYLQICCGTVDTVVGQFPKSYHNLFDKNGVEHNWFEITGAGHDGRIINPGFETFAGELF